MPFSLHPITFTMVYSYFVPPLKRHSGHSPPNISWTGYWRHCGQTGISTALGCQRANQILKLRLDVIHGRDGTADLVVQDLPVPTAQAMNGLLDRTFAHLKCQSELVVRHVHLVAGQKWLHVLE